MFATPIQYAMYVASKLGHLLWFPIGGPSHTSSVWLSDGLCSVATLRRLDSQMKARRYDDASVGYPIFPVDTADRYGTVRALSHSDGRRPMSHSHSIRGW